MKEFPYEEFRVGQREISERIEKDVPKGKFILINAPTGFGKTIAVLYGLARSIKSIGKVIYVVRTRNELVPVLKELKKLGVSFTFLFSAKKMCPYAIRKELTFEDFWITCKVLRAKGICKFFRNLVNYDVKDVWFKILKYSPKFTNVVNELIKDSICPYFALIQLIKESKFIVATYPYFFKEEIFTSAFSGMSYEDFTVVDEAHTLINPTSIYDEEISPKALTEAISEIKQYTQHNRAVVNYLMKLNESLNKLPKTKTLRYLPKSEVISKEVREHLVDTVLEIKLKTLQLVGHSPEDLMRTKLRISKIATTFQLALNDNFEIFYFTKREANTFKVLPVTFKVITKGLNLVKGGVLMSSTLSPKEFFEQALGINNVSSYINVEEIYGPIFHPENTVTLVITDVSSSYLKRSETMYMKYVRYLSLTYKYIDNITLAKIGRALKRDTSTI